MWSRSGIIFLWVKSEDFDFWFWRTDDVDDSLLLSKEELLILEADWTKIVKSMKDLFTNGWNVIVDGFGFCWEADSR